MEFKIIIDYSVNSEEKVIPLEKKIEYEYHRKVIDKEEKKEEIICDIVNFENNKIVIEGSRVKPIKIKDCWRSKKSNYRRCILSSLFYLYNYYKIPIHIESIKINDLKSEEDIPFNQEFKAPLPNDFSIDLTKIEYIFKRISFPELSEVVYSILHSQALFLKNKDFYSSYKSFNSMYTFYYNYHEKLQESGSNKNADKDAIIALLNLDNLESDCQKSVSLAEKYFTDKFKEVYKLSYVWLLEENISEGRFKGVICDQNFIYKNKNVLKLINDLVKNYYNIDLPCNKVINKFEKRYNLKSYDYKINYLQFLSVYAVYRRNKLLHGEHVDSTFLIPDVNADILFKFSEIIFQFSIDLVNSIAVKDFTISKILENTSKRYL